ncbi:hypothetical protein OJ996_15360 [Luteolibacter sp. GHJ8]|uniref:Uncharacterized protein n=1 Tax=Luteolibacter rhizosphaerae TaxID=2989719 RepID=A0ABT3G545_9BACT|nr:hypothetical protein [Luteolibacter rhizosphaerae]MCW1914966.1 hypothetical protein [Luteolibacter rhizosphaerae]
MNSFEMKDLGHHELLGELDPDRTLFFCCASFEERSTKLPIALADHPWTQVSVFFNSDVDGGDANSAKILEAMGGCASVQKTSVGSPLETADRFYDVIEEAEVVGSKLVVDFSTFTHEHLLILVKCLETAGVNLEEIVWIYCRVEEYSVGERAEHKWLSRGVFDIRSVLGYSGRISPELPTALLLLVGFEAERACGVVDCLEPHFLLLGKGTSANSESEEMHLVNRHFHKLIRDSVRTMPNDRIRDFEFPCNDPATVARMVTRFAEMINGVGNLVVVPMNTKISTLGIAWAFCNFPVFQVVYAQAYIYNYKSYSKPSDRCYLMRGLFAGADSAPTSIRPSFETQRSRSETDLEKVFALA